MDSPLVDALDEVYVAIVVALDDRGPHDFERPTRAAEWTVKQLLFHLSLDAVRALIALAGPTDARPDVDACTYWRPFRPDAGDAGAGHARFVQRSADAFEFHRELLHWWVTTSGAAVQAARRADGAARIRTQGHVLTVSDFVSTLLVEATVHYLDLTLDLPWAAPPQRVGLAETRRVLEGLLGSPLPATWDDTEAALKGTGRLDLTDADRTVLGDRAAAIPLLG